MGVNISSLVAECPSCNTEITLDIATQYRAIQILTTTQFCPVCAHEVTYEE